MLGNLTFEAFIIDLTFPFLVLFPILDGFGEDFSPTVSAFACGAVSGDPGRKMCLCLV